MGLTGASVHGGFEHLWFDVGRVKIWLRSQAACGVGGGTGGHMGFWAVGGCF